jgi:hypothetical protein
VSQSSRFAGRAACKGIVYRHVAIGVLEFWENKEQKPYKNIPSEPLLFDLA